jgi:glycosyltransferase involved in cell wall biosynthesis
LNPKVTVYITNYNYGPYLEQAIQSVLNQTFTDYELIIIDDGSTDNSKEIINNYKKNKNVYAVFQKNKGLNTSNNVALNLARGKYIVRLDADDYFAPQAVELMVAELERMPGHALVFPDYYNIDIDGNIIEEIKRHDFSNNVTLFDQPAHGACTMIRTDILRSIGGYDEEFNCQDGYDIWLRLLQLYPVKNISLPLFFYRQHQKSITKNEEQLFKTRTQIVEKNVKKRKLKELRVLAIIPVRGKKVDPSSDPLRMVGDKHLIEWTINAAIESDFIQNIAISSSDNELKKFINKKYGDKIIWIEREKELTNINTSIEKTAIHALNIYERNHQEIDSILMLYSDFPFRSTMYINQAIHMFQLHDVDSISTVRKDEDMFFVHSGHGLEPWRRSNKLRLERDDLYRRAGGLHLINKNILLEKKNMLYGKMGHVVVDKKAAFKVRSDFDFKVADIIAKGKN